MAREIFFLDWNVDLLFGFENRVLSEGIESIRKGIALGDKIPPVIVETYYNPILQEFENITGIVDCTGAPDIDFDKSRIYRLSDSVIHPKTLVLDGGHHRAVAHYLERKPLPCRWPNDDDKRGVTLGTYNPFIWKFIHEIPIIEGVLIGKELLEFDHRKVVHGFYR
ncbi:MAG: hypothetical protein AABW79_00750 [Nanoarchaeota archaeon]